METINASSNPTTNVKKSRLKSAAILLSKSETKINEALRKNYPYFYLSFVQVVQNTSDAMLTSKSCTSLLCQVVIIIIMIIIILAISTLHYITH